MLAQTSIQSGLSRYGQLAVQLRQRILNGEWQPGDGLPSEAQLARDYGVALGTLRQAIAVLVEDGLLSREHGRGTFVREGLTGASMLRFFRLRGGDGDSTVPQSRILSRRLRRALANERDAFGLPTDGRVLALQRLRSLDGKPCLLEHIVLPLPLFQPLVDGAPSDWGALLYPLFQQRCGVVVARAQDALSIVALNEDQGRWLGLPAGAPGLCVARRAYDRAGACVELRTTLGDAFSFSYAAEVR